MSAAVPSLTQDEAVRRAALLEVQRYDIALDLTGLADGPELRAVSTVSFTCREPGASTFVDCVAEVVSVTLNGTSLTPDAGTPGRITLDGLADHNVLVVASVQRETEQKTAVHRSVDPSDGEVYVWTSFEPDEARRAWACFDQPDLKAPHAFTVLAPSAWMVLSCSGDLEVEAIGDHRSWTFAATPALSTYVPVVNAGPFHALRRERNGHALGLYCRRSLAPFLDRDADELFDLTSAGLAFFGERFGMPFPQRSYDQVFVPDMGGAMENYGCVTWSDAFLVRSEPSPADRELRARVLLHEMAHMWFGDIVTMTWWDDLWLNEAFADWAAYWASASVTVHTDIWASFLVGQKLQGYAADRAPTRHPIRQPTPDVATAQASFDSITYRKGASVLKQLVATVGEDIFVAALRAYFARHAWGNATLDDLVGELERASGRDLTGWVEGWLDTAGTDVITLTRAADELVLHVDGPDGSPPRPHRLDLGRYHRTDGGGLTQRDAVAVQTTGATTAVPEPGGQPDLLLVNDGDLTFATVLPDAAAVRALLDHGAELPTSMARALAVTTAWELVAMGRLPAFDVVGLATAVLRRETADTVVEPVLDLAVRAAELWSPEVERERLMAEVADACLVLAGGTGSRRQVAARALARTAVTDEHLAGLADLVGDDVDLGWRRLVRLAALDRLEDGAVAALQDRDPDPDAWVRAFAVEGARPSSEAKDAVWEAAVTAPRLPFGGLREVAAAFWQPGQDELLRPYAERYVLAVPVLGSDNSGMLPAMAAARSMYPFVGVDEGFVDRATAAGRAAGVSPVVAQIVLERTDELRRMLLARRATAVSRSGTAVGSDATDAQDVSP